MTEPIDFYKGLNFYTLEEGILIRAILELTYRCNFSCVHCYCADSRQRQELTTEDWKRVIDELANGDGEASEGHGIEREPERVEHDGREQERKRQSHHADDRRAQAPEKKPEHSDDQESAVAQHRH